VQLSVKRRPWSNRGAVWRSRSFVLVATLLVAFSVWGGHADATTRSVCDVMRVAVPNRGGLLVVRFGYCLNGVDVLGMSDEERGVAAQGWTYRGVIHERHIGTASHSKVGIWVRAQFCHGATEIQCLGTTDSTFPTAWLLVSAAGAYQVGREVNDAQAVSPSRTTARA
jgi:hypothetical protein